MKLLFVLSLLGLFTVSAFAEEKVDCQAELRAYIYGPWAIAKGMADYKAAMDAGYEVCSKQEPEQFEEANATYDFLRDNTEKEMEQARAVLDYLIDNPNPKKITDECMGNEQAQGALKKEISASIDGQYRKAYDRRAKSLATELSDEGMESCKLVSSMISQYGKHYDEYKQLHYVLYESSKKQGQIVLTGSDRKQSFRSFEKTREKLSHE